MGSLQDQLLKAGLTNEHKAKLAKSEKRKAQKKKHIEQTKQAQQEKANQLNEQRQKELKEREQVARVKQILEHHNQDEIRGELTFNFTYDNKIKEIDVNAQTQQALAKGRLAICVLEGQFYVLQDEPARKIAEVDEKYIVFHVENEDDQKDEDDPYADYEVPDDLIW